MKPLRLCALPAAGRLCVSIFFLKERKPSAGCARILSFFLAKKRSPKEKSYNLCGSAPLREYSLFFTPTTEAFYYSRKEGKTLREVIQPLRLRVFARVFFSRKVGMTCLRKAGAKRSYKNFASLRLCETIFFKLSKKESLPQGSREYSLFFSQRTEACLPPVGRREKELGQISNAIF